MEAPDERWLPFLKVVLGFCIVLMIGGLAVVFGLGKVEEKTSFGLKDITTCLVMLSGMFAQWAFGKDRK